MNFSEHLANNFREVQLNGKWVVLTNLKAELDDVSLEEATTQIGKLNTIALLTFHLNYYVAGVADAMESGELTIRDKYSFDLPPLESPDDWDRLRTKTYQDAERFAQHIEQLSDEQLAGPFVDEKYGTYFRNLTAMIEHTYYHLGQIVLIKKLIRQGG